MKDIVCKFPDELLEYLNRCGFDFKDISYKQDDICNYDDNYFIHCRAVLPFGDLENGVGFGLWVKVNKSDFERFLQVEEKNDVGFEAKGVLANEWPGFEGMREMKVNIHVLEKDKKPVIVELETTEKIDPGFLVAKNMEKGDLAGYSQLREMVKAWLPDYRPERL